MLYTYFMTAFRTLLRHKGYSAITILGLSVGLASCLILMLAVQDELTFDQFNRDGGNRLFRVVQNVMSEKGKINRAMSTLPLALTLKQSIPEIEYASRIAGLGRISARIVNGETAGRSFQISPVGVDPDFFRMFDYTFVEGSKENALSELNSVVLTQTEAERLFGKQAALGKTFSTSFGGVVRTMVVTGVIKDPPANVSYNVAVTMRIELLPFYEAAKNDWRSISCDTFVKLRESTQREDVHAKLPSFVGNYYAEEIQDLKNVGIKPDERGVYAELFLQSYTDVHFNIEIQSKGLVQDGSTGPGRSIVYILGGIGGLILLIASINFVNLSIARSLTRAREVGVRKSLGAHRSTIILQFLGEAVIIVLLAFILSLGIAEVCLPYCNTLLLKQLALSHAMNVPFIVGTITVVILTAVGAGSYPAFYISSFSASIALKEGVRGARTSLVRNLLVICQFTIAIMLIAATVVVREQVNYMVRKDIGFAKEELIAVPLGDGGETLLGRLSVEARSLGFVTSVTGSSENIGRGLDGSMYNSQIGTQDRGKTIQYNLISGTSKYAETLGLTLLEGHDFTEQSQQDEVLINERMAEQLTSVYGYQSKQELIGSRIGADSNAPRIIGLVKDYHFRALRQNIKPLVIARPNPIGNIVYAFLRVNLSALSGTDNGEKISSAMTQLKNVWARIQPNDEFQGSFANDNVERMYRRELRMNQLIMTGSIVAIMLACIGLFALTTLMITHRTKEIGVRKVLGASEWSIVRLLMGDFARLIVIAMIFGLPIAWYSMHEWIAEYAYRIHLSPLLFAVSGTLALVIALATISVQALRAARINPVRALKTE